jgi:hypothetical protein
LRSVYRAQNSLKVYGASFLAFSLLFSIGAWHGFSVGIHTWVDLAIGIALACVGTFFAARVSQQSLIKRGLDLRACR